jgi:pimeloyl-ACP methyl ester carboxylesterase
LQVIFGLLPSVPVANHLAHNFAGDPLLLLGLISTLVVFYDQIGCVASTHLPQTTGDESFWQESLFLAELDNLLDFLQLRDGPGYHILGHSWGRRIAVTFATTKPRVLQRLVLASGIASSRSWVEGIQIIRRQLPSDAQLAIDEEEQKGNFESARFRDVTRLI